MGAEETSAAGVGGEGTSLPSLLENLLRMEENSTLAFVSENPYTFWTPEEDGLWMVVNKNPLNYHAWMVLIDVVEKAFKPDLSKIRQVYKAFLRRFPLCVEQWNNLAHHEGHVDSNAAMKVYEEAIPVYSVKLWHHYCQFAISIGKDSSFIRRLFERGLELVGTDYHSNLLWDSYIKYEETKLAWNNVANIYTRLFNHPIQDLDLFFSRFKELAELNALALLLHEDDADLDGSDKDSGVKCSSEKDTLAKYISARQVLYNKAKEYESKIVIFEQSITRSSYELSHVEDLEARTWHNYLEFIEREDPAKATKLYERCLIPCATRADIWMRYIEFLEERNMLEEANRALCRALCFVEKSAKSEICIFSARYKERVGDIFGAREQYRDIYSKICPGSHEALEAHANMERRLGNNECASSVYEAAIAAERQKRPLGLPALLVQYAEFTYFALKDVHRSRNILRGLCGLNLTKPLIKAVIDLESMFPGRRCVELLDSLVQKFLLPDSTDGLIPTETEKREVSDIYLEFLGKFGDSHSIHTATKCHISLFGEASRNFYMKRAQSANNDANLKKRREDAAKDFTTLQQFLMENDVIEDFEIHVGSLKGQYITKTTKVGSRLLRGIYRAFRRHHECMVSWFGDFDANDIMVTYNGSSSLGLTCSFKKQAVEAATFVCITLDYKRIETILSPFFVSGSTGRRPAYLSLLFNFAMDPPANFLSHDLARDLFLRQISVNPALLSPSNRMKLYRELQLFLEDACFGSHESFSNYFPLKGFTSQALVSVIAGDELLSAAYNRVLVKLENPGNLDSEKVCGSPKRADSLDAAKAVNLFTELDLCVVDHLKGVSGNIDGNEEMCHIFECYCDSFMYGMTRDLCRATDMHMRLKAICHTFSEGE